MSAVQLSGPRPWSLAKDPPGLLTRRVGDQGDPCLPIELGKGACQSSGIKVPYVLLTIKHAFATIVGTPEPYSLTQS